MRQIGYHPRVPREIGEIVGYYAGISDRLADDFWSELTAAFEHAREQPKHHHFDASGRQRGNLTRFPYHFLFGFTANQVKIMVVRHNSRSPGYGSKRN